MAQYRFFLIGADGRIYHGLEAECLDDEYALDWAKRRPERCDIEVWQRHRRVGTIRVGPNTYA